MFYSNPEVRASQCTIAEPIHCIGAGLHSGHKVSMTLLPAPPNHGILFVRRDVDPGHAMITASWRNVVDTRMCTVLGNEHGITLSTVEHLTAALRICGIDNLLIEINSDEAPILDGSSEPFVAMLKKAGIVAQRLPRYSIWIERPVEVRHGEHFAILSPGFRPSITVEIEFPHKTIGAQKTSILLRDDVLENSIAPARTFDFAGDLRQLHADGLALGGSMRNAVLVDDAGVVNAEGLRFDDEYARHKILDCLGDLALAQVPIFDQLYAFKPGHRLNNALLRELFANGDAWRRLPCAEILERSHYGAHPVRQTT